MPTSKAIPDNELFTTVFDEETLNDFLEPLETPYPKDRETLARMQEAISGLLQNIVHTLLDIPDDTQPLFPLRKLLTEPRVRHLTCEQAQAANIYHSLLILEKISFWVIAVHYLIRAYVLDDTGTVKLPANRKEALTLWDLSGDQLGTKHDPDPDSWIEVRFLLGGHRSPRQVLKNGPDFTLGVENEDIILRVVLEAEPPAFIFSETIQDPETDAITDPKTWEKISTQQLADVPGLAKRFRRHHLQNIHRVHVFTWPKDFLPVMKTLDNPQNTHHQKTMDPFFQNYLSRQADLDLPQNREGLRRIAQDTRNPCHLLARLIDTLPESQAVFPIEDYLQRKPDTKDTTPDVTTAFITYYDYLQDKAFNTWLHYLNVYVLDAVHERPQPHLDKRTLTTQARDKGDVHAFDFFERGPDFHTSYAADGTLLITTEPLFNDTGTTAIWNHITVREANQKNLTFESEPFAYHFTWPAEVLDPLQPS